MIDLHRLRAAIACLVFVFAVFSTHVASAEPRKVVVGAYINDIQAIDLQNHAYVMDIYVWFRWADDDVDPTATFEFMNVFDPEGHVEKVFYEQSLDQPDGSRYNLIRHQGAFSSKFDMSDYPFDKQRLSVIVEDQEMGAEDLMYVADDVPVTLNPDIRLPGYNIQKVSLGIEGKPYPTFFGDLSNPDVSAYSRIRIDVEISRPVLSGALKTLLPLVLVVCSAVFALFLDPTHVEARVGLTITSLLALVALQLNLSSILPEVGYLLMIDQVYLLSYLMVLVTVFMVVYATRHDEQGGLQGKAGSLHIIATNGPLWALAIMLFYLLSFSAILYANLILF